MLRVNSNAVLVVPPFECAWLQGPEKIESGCCVSFEVKGENDVTIILKSEAGGRRWQHFAHNGGNGAMGQHGNGAQHAGDTLQRTERNYTVILGSHRNSCIKIEKDGQLCDRADNVPGTKLSASQLLQFWVSYSAGSISIGTGAPGSQPPCYSWLDPGPPAAIEHVGLSSWDHHVAYRNIQITAPVPLPPQDGDAAAADQQTAAGGVGSTPSLQDQCSAALQRAFRPASVCTVLSMADVMRPSADVLRDAAVAFLAEHLPAVLAADAAGLQALSFDCMLDVLKHPALGCEESIVFTAVAVWARCEAACRVPDSSGSADGDTPKADSYSSAVNGSIDGSVDGGTGDAHPDPDPALDQLLPLVRFPLMADEELAALAAHPLRYSSTVLSDLLTEAQICHQAEESRQQPSCAAECAQVPAALEVADMRHVRLRTSSADAAAARRQQRRPGAGATELMFVSHGDTNGVCHWLGRNRGTSPWVNPHAAGRLTVRASSPACRNTDPKALVGLNFARVNFAGPRLEGGGRATWWSLDLGPGCVLACNYYTLRADASPNFPRSWSLQASQDGSTWVDLRRHTSDTSLSLPGQFASWPVGGPAAQRPYRRFRVLLAQGPGAAVTHPTELSLSHFELYGWATVTAASKDAESSG